MERFFYHSFPRRGPKGPDAERLGLAILQSMARNGLLLVPEEVTWIDPTQPNPASKVRATQRRICFTELSPAELAEHGKHFGNFAIEFTVTALRSLGALPVIYVPDAHDGTYAPMGALGAAFMSYLAGARALLQMVGDSMAAPGSALKLTTTTKDGRVTSRQLTVEETEAIKEFISIAQETEGLTFRATSNAISRLASLFYPVEDLQFTGPLGYYRQREWRLTGDVILDGTATTTLATPLQASELLELDAPFFSRKFELTTGVTTLAEASHFMREVRGAHVLTWAKRIVVPTNSVESAKAIVAGVGLNPAMVG